MKLKSILKCYLVLGAFIVITGCDIGSPSCSIFGSGGGPDTTPPAVSFLKPANNTQRGNLAIVEITASDNGGVKTLTLTVDNGSGVVLISENPPGTYSKDLYLSAGSHTLKATAVDYADNSSTVQITVPVVNGNIYVSTTGSDVHAASIPARGRFGRRIDGFPDHKDCRRDI